MTFWFRIASTLWLGHFISRYLKEHFMLIKYTRDSNSQTLRMRFPFQSNDRQISHRNVWSSRVYMIPLRDFAPEWNSRPGTTTGVKSPRGDSRRHDILWWYHVNKCRAMRAREPEWTHSGAKVAPVSCKHPLRFPYRATSSFTLFQFKQIVNINWVETSDRCMGLVGNLLIGSSRVYRLLLFNFYTLYEFRFSDWRICTTWYWVVTKQPPWRHYRGVNSTHHCHYTLASADSKFEDLTDADIDSLVDDVIPNT